MIFIDVVVSANELLVNYYPGSHSHLESLGTSWFGIERKCLREDRGSLENQKVRVAREIARFSGETYLLLFCRLWKAKKERSRRSANVSRGEAGLSHLKVGRSGTLAAAAAGSVASCSCCLHDVRVTCH